MHDCMYMIYIKPYYILSIDIFAYYTVIDENGETKKNREYKGKPKETLQEVLQKEQEFDDKSLLLYQDKPQCSFESPLYEFETSSDERLQIIKKIGKKKRAM